MMPEVDTIREEGPTPPPHTDRRVRLYPGQWVGIPLLMLIPVLASLGLVDERRAHVRGASEVLSLHAEYPQRLRKGRPTTIEVRVENVSAAHLPALVVAFDSAYLGHFAKVAFTPSPQHAHGFELPGLAPGESRVLRVHFEADRAWRRAGGIVASVNGETTARVQLRTFVLP